MELDPSLTRKLLFSSSSNNSPTATNQRIAQDALQAAGELIRQFIIETRHRASIEAEFENEMSNNNGDDDSRSNKNQGSFSKSKGNRSDDDDNDVNDSDDSISSSLLELRKRKRGKRTGNDKSDHFGEDGKNHIQPKHVLKVSAEILMDFS